MLIVEIKNIQFLNGYQMKLIKKDPKGLLLNHINYKIIPYIHRF